MRIELIHPLIVAFPIAFLLLGVCIRLAAFFLRKRESYQNYIWFSRLILSLGIISSILAIISGEIAHNYVHEKLCVHDDLDNHQLFAFTATLLFAAGFLLDMGKNFGKPMRFMGIVLYWIAPIFLILTTLYGGKLVFEQGAAVEKVCNGRTNAKEKPPNLNF